MFYDECVQALLDRGVKIEDIANCAEFLHKPYQNDITKEEIISNIQEILKKREVQNAVLTAIELDRLCEEDKFHNKEFQKAVLDDDGLYGIDEVLAYGICNIYGSIALTNFGYIDKVKPSIIGVLNEPQKGCCNTFLDDIVGAIAASAASRLAHGKKD